MKKTITAILSVAMVASMFSACAFSGSDQNSAASKAGGTSSEAVELDVTHPYPKEQMASDATNQTAHELMDEFQKENQGITLNQTEMEQSNYATKIQAQAAANDLPDVFWVKGSWMKNFSDNSVLTALDKYVDAQKLKDGYRDGTLSAPTIGGKLYGLPFTCGLTSSIFYNETILKSVGYDSFPTTWDGIFQLAQKLNAKGTPLFALGNKDKWAIESCVLSALSDRFLGTDWTNSLIANGGKSKFTDKGFVDTLTLIQKMAKCNLFNKDFNTITNTQADSLFSQGKTAATVSGSWTIAYVIKNASKETAAATKLALLPTVSGGKGEASATSGGSGWYICINSKLTGAKLDAAAKLVTYLGGDKASQKFQEKGIIGARKENTDLSKLESLQKEYIEQANSVKTTPIFDARLNSSVVDVMNSGMQELLNGTTTPEALASKIQAEQDKVK